MPLALSARAAQAERAKGGRRRQPGACQFRDSGFVALKSSPEMLGLKRPPERFATDWLAPITMCSPARAPLI